MKSKIIASILAIVLIVGVYYLLSKLNEPSNKNLSEAEKKAALEHVLGRPAILSVTPDKEGNVAYKSHYMQFSYPAKATIYNYRQEGYRGSKGLLDTFSFDIKIPRLIFSIEAFDRPVNVENVSDYPGARLRHDQGSLYKESKISINGVEGLSYTKTENGAEKTAFLMDNDTLYTISASGVDIDDVNRLFDSVVKTLVTY